MPYKRYDVRNKYNHRGRRVNERMGLKVLFLFLIPVLIVLVVLLGVYLGYNAEMKQRPKLPAPATVDEADTVSDEQLLHIVNEHYPLEADYEPELVSFGGIRVAKVAFESLDDLIKDAASQGITITVKKGYVSYSEQEKLFDETFKKVKKDNDYSEIKAESETMKICPRAGCSENQTGMLLSFATDEKGDFAKTRAGKWLEKYSVNYGFVLRYPEGEEGNTGLTYAPDVYRYVGEEHALNMRRFDMILESYSYHVTIR
ncbi:MAG: M15 family metallopeptidase [Ruminococcus sp.]|nr:M15 family metallopeptidase [Ruminococcus sp.]